MRGAVCVSGIGVWCFIGDAKIVQVAFCLWLAVVFSIVGSVTGRCALSLVSEVGCGLVKLRAPDLGCLRCVALDSVLERSCV